jgi:hypothetical protein
MQEGADRVDVDWIWPATLQHPPRLPKLIYFDLNHWVALAKALSGHRDGAEHRDVLTACLNASSRRAAVFPISDTIFIEVSKIPQYRQRRDLREVIEQLSWYAVVTCRSVVATHEIEAMLDRIVGPSMKPINTMRYLDWGIARALGKVGGFRIRTEDGRDITAQSRSSWKDGPAAFDAIFAQAELELQRRTLDGPSPSEEPEMRELGWDPSGTFEVAKRRARQEVEQVARFDSDPSWRRGRIRDVVAAREVLIEINEALSRGISERGSTLETIFPSLELFRRALDAMPSFDVAVTIKTSYHRDPRHRWTPNDIHDIDALGSTMPYCDVVVTDKAVASHANRTGLAQRLGTVVLPRLSDVLSHL